jgi:uroporphyrinogen-III synthase
VSGKATPPSFGGARVLLLESRLAAETAAMVRRLGGEPISAPAVIEAPIDANGAVLEFIERLQQPGDHLVTFLTGAAVTRVFEIAERLELASLLQDGLRHTTIVARGPKPTGALAKRGLAPALAVASPFTTADVLTALDTLPVAGREATVVHYGERNEPIVSALGARGAVVRDLVVYEWQLPLDVAPLVAAIDSILKGDLPILALTSQIQLRHLLFVAGPLRQSLLEALNTRVLVGAVGPTCAAACHEAGIEDVVVPQQPKLAPMLVAIAAARARAENHETTNHE